MDIERGTTKRIFQPGRPTPGLGYFLVQFTKDDTGAITTCLVQNSGNAAGPLVLDVEETGASTAVPLSGEVQLAVGDWTMTVYEQSSTTNLNPSLANVTRWSERVRVWDDAAIAPPAPYDPCDYCDQSACPYDITVNVNGTFVQTVTGVDPCVANTLNINITA